MPAFLSAARATRSLAIRLGSFAGPLRIATYNLDLVGLDHGLAVVHLEGYILDEESPYFVAESVRIEASLQRVRGLTLVTCVMWERKTKGLLNHLELKSGLDVLVQAFGDGLIKVSEDLHRQLRIDARATNQVVERIGQRKANATKRSVLACVICHDESNSREN